MMFRNRIIQNLDRGLRGIVSMGKDLFGVKYLARTSKEFYLIDNPASGLIYRGRLELEVLR
jgi:hypothetical protein